MLVATHYMDFMTHYQNGTCILTQTQVQQAVSTDPVSGAAGVALASSLHQGHSRLSLCSVLSAV